MAGLVSDPARQAHDTFRGYIYQILRSILVWLDLGDEEQLFLEGAEDLDRIDHADVLTEQVKDTVGSGNITLRTPSVVEAINNFWSHRTRNPGAAIRFRYVTTSGIGVEQGSPFGTGRGGLDLWNALRASGSGAEADDQISLIAEFLLGEGNLSNPVKQRFSDSSPAELLEQIISPIEWLAGQQDGDALVRQIKDRLVTHGAASTIPPADAELAFDALYTAAFDAAKQKDGVPLTRAQFLRIFASATGIHVPKQDLLALMRAAMSPAGGDIAVQAQPLILEGPPPLPHQYFRRTTVEQTFEASLSMGTVLLHGSTGSGKTLSAASTFAGRDPLWLTLRDLTPAEVKTRLLAASELLRAEGVARILVVDDLDTLSDPRLIEGSLGALWHCQNGLGGQLVITADRPLPERLAQAVQLESARELQMQPFDAGEIEAFLRESGCPDERAALWSKLLELSTLGHPQLVSARVCTLRSREYPEPEASDLLGTADDVDRIKFEARRLIADLPEGARELLLRASLMTGRVTRHRLMAIGRLQEPIAEPGVAVDIIAGPWLEMTDDREFRVSPLARGAAEQLRGQDWTKAMHGQLAWTYLLDRTVSPWDISAILMHCYIAGTAGPLVYVSQGMFSAGDETWDAVGEACGFYTALGLDASNPLPFKKPIDVFVFRILQYRIAAETNPDIAMRIAVKIEEEFAAAPDDDLRRFFRFLYLSQFLSVVKVRYPIALVVARALEFFDVARALETSLPDRMAQAGLEADEDLPAGGYAQFASLRLFSHIQDIDEFAALFEALKARTPEDARALLESIGLPDDMSSVLVERLWLAQHGTKDGRWGPFRDKLRDAFDFSVQVGANSMARAIAPVLLRTINENMGDATGAVAEAGQLGPVVDDDPIYLCALAKVKSDAGDYPKAKELWCDALPRWPKADDDIGCAFAYRTAAIASGRHGDWLDAASYFDTAKRLVEDGTRPTFTIGLTVDAALARFMAGQRGEAVAEFGAIVAALDPLQADYEREPLLSLQRRTGGVLSATAGWSAGERTDEELSKLVGLCSNLDPFETDAPVAPPLDTLRLDLIRLELACGASLDGSLREAPKVRASPIMSFRAGGGPVLFTLAQRTLDFSKVVADGLRQLDALAMLAEQIAMDDRDVMREDDGKPRTWSPGADELLIGNMTVAVFGLAAANELDRLPFARWRADGAAHPQGGRVVQLVDHLEGLFVTGAIEPWATVLNCPSSDWSHHAASALAATLLERLAPDALLVAQALWVHYFKQAHLAPLVVHYLAYLVTRQWRAVVAMPALFGSAAPSLPPLVAALAGPGEGWPKVRTVLQAALLAVPLAVDDNARTTIEGMEL
jgi:tetratricopeptide (TPR) repeat protein